MKPSIFISYRRDDAAGYAGRLADHLDSRFGDANVFRDIEDLEGGTDFEKAIVDAVSHCRALIVIIGPSWLEARNAAGDRRLDDPRDYVRLEIEAALERDVLVLPVLVGDASMPSPAELPDSLAPLSRRQARPLSDDRWSFDVDRVIRALEPTVRHRDRSGLRRVATAAAMVSVLLLGFTVAMLRGWFGGGNGGRDSTVPSVIGLTVDAAREALAGAGLALGTVTTEASGRTKPGLIHDQKPVAGSRTTAGTVVSVLVEGDPQDDEIARGGRINLAPTNVFDLDGNGTGAGIRTEWDMSLREPRGGLVISPGNRATIAISPRPPDRATCDLIRNRLANTPLSVADAMASGGICARTSSGNIAAIEISALERRSRTITFSYTTWPD
jgi:hypothetical protein